MVGFNLKIYLCLLRRMCDRLFIVVYGDQYHQHVRKYKQK